MDESDFSTDHINCSNRKCIRIICIFFFFFLEPTFNTKKILAIQGMRTTMANQILHPVVRPQSLGVGMELTVTGKTKNINRSFIIRLQIHVRIIF